MNLFINGGKKKRKIWGEEKEVEEYSVILYIYNSVTDIIKSSNNAT